MQGGAYYFDLEHSEAIYHKFSGGSRGVRSSSDEPPFFPSDQLTASHFSGHS